MKNPRKNDIMEIIEFALTKVTNIELSLLFEISDRIHTAIIEENKKR